MELYCQILTPYIHEDLLKNFSLQKHIKSGSLQSVNELFSEEDQNVFG